MHHPVLPRLRTKFAERAFSYAGPAAWNRLPESLRRTSSQAAFKRKLKTFLFYDAFNIVAWIVCISIHERCNAAVVF